MRARWALILAASVALTVGMAVPAAATDPVDVGADFVLDSVDILSDTEQAKVESRLAVLSTDTGVGLYVAFVSEFTNPSNSADWARETAVRNEFGKEELLFAVAVDSRQFYIDSAPDAPISPEQVAAVEAAITPLLRENDFAGAVTAAADEIEDATSSGMLNTFIVIIFAVILALLLLVMWRLTRRRSGSATGPSKADEVPVERLHQQAASALIATDNAIKASEQELGFARAQFGDESTAEFTEVLTAAKADLESAFLIQQQLDDGTPETEEQIRSGYAQIIELCNKANSALDAKTEAFDALREVAKNAPEALARAQTKHARMPKQIEEATSLLASLHTQYAEQALQSVADNPEQAQQRLTFANEQLAAAESAVGAGDGDEAAIGIRSAEGAFAQITQLCEAVGTLRADLAASETVVNTLIAELQQDVATASTLPDPSGQIAPIIAATQAQVSTAIAALGASNRDPVTIERNLNAANVQIDTVVQSVRDAQQQAERARSVLAQTLARAQAQASSTESYIASRRGAVGATARTRLAKAQAALAQAQALQTTDPDQALIQARRADHLSDQALKSAQADVGGFDPVSDTGTSMIGGLIGGLIGGALSGDSAHVGVQRSFNIFGGASSGWSTGSSSRRSSGFSFGGGSGRSFGGGRSGRRGGGRF